jgi:hypothetical protein
MTKQNKYHGKTIEIGSCPIIRTINLYQNHSEKCFLFRSEFFFRTTQELEFFFGRAKREFFSRI